MDESGQLTLNNRQRKAIKALCEQATVVAAAEASKVSTSALYEWLQMPHFRQALTAAQGDVTAEALRKLSALQAEAVDVLAALLRGDAPPGNVPPNVVRLAASDILTHRRALAELVDIETRLTALEVGNGKN